MQLIIFIGIPASGKSSFFRDRFVDSHIRLNLDMLKTRHREKLMFDACLESKTDCVIDNTNPTAADRARYIEKVKEHDVEVVGYYFRSVIAECIERNKTREGKKRVPDAAIGGIAKKLELPEYSEGFDALWYVSLTDQGFEVAEWSDDET